MNDFYRTPAGRKFYDADMPRLISALEKIALKMDESNKLDERKFKLEEKLMKQQLKEVNESLKESSGVNPRQHTGSYVSELVKESVSTNTSTNTTQR
jgi:hypothetical protein